MQQERYQFYDDGGFAADGALPDRRNPRQWVAWHFTHESNIAGILDAGALLPSTVAAPSTNVGQLAIKHDRESRVVDPGPGYPPSVVAQHIPLYYAAKSPMLYKVCCGHDDYRGGSEPLVFLGFKVGEIADSGCLWCASNANAATGWARFSRNVDQLGSFVDFPLLKERMWSRTEDDAGRPSRRAAELLVRDRLPVDLVRIVVTKSRRVQRLMQQMFDKLSRPPEVQVRAAMYY